MISEKMAKLAAESSEMVSVYCSSSVSIFLFKFPPQLTLGDQTYSPEVRAGPARRNPYLP
jgi:hypothetical protein